MTAPDAALSSTTDPVEEFAYAAGLQAYVYGLPLVESMRTAAQMTAVPAPQPSGRAPLNHFGHSERPWTHLDRDIVTPANDLLYSMAWLDLGDEPVVLSVPAESQRYWVMALLDAYTNNFVNIGPRTTQGRAMRFALAGPGWSGALPDGVELVRSPTRLVWILGRTLVDDEDDLSAARAVETRFTLAPLSGRDKPFARYATYADGADALDFFDNLARGLAENPPPEADAGLVAMLGRAGIRADVPVREDVLDPRAARGLRRGFDAGRRFVESTTVSRRAGVWAMNTRMGRFGTDYVVRAATAAKGLGGLASDEALYAMSDFDSGREPLHGSRRYLLRFGAGELPPCDAFWSVSLYGEDRYFTQNAIGRYAIGDRSRGLAHGADGSLEIVVSHEAPAVPSNWLPAPQGAFYLVLRMYHPREEVRTGGYRIPPVQRIG